MTEQLQLRRGTAAQVAAFTGAQGEVVIDTTNQRVVVNDGATAGGWPAEISVRTPVSDAAYSALVTDRIIAYTAITAARAVSLPAAASYPVGSILWIVDESGSCSTTNTITATPHGSDAIEGLASAALNGPYGALGLESNGANGWTIAAVRIHAVSRTPVSDASYSALITDRTIAYTAITAARTVSLPAAEAFPSGAGGVPARLAIVDESGACSASKTITVNRAGSDTIDGATSFVIEAAYGGVELESNGSNAWTILSPRPNLQASLIGVGTAPDPNNPLSVYGASALFNGATSMNVTVNKNGSGATASFIFEDAFSGRAQIGLNGSDNFSFKVSPNGSSWVTGIALDATTGAATFANQRTPVSDAAYSALVTDRLVAYTALTAARVVSLPAAASYPPGQALTVADESGACSATDTITLSPSGSDTINGATSAAISTAYGYVALESNGSNAWTIIDQSTFTAGSTAGSIGYTGSVGIGTNAPAALLHVVGAPGAPKDAYFDAYGGVSVTQWRSAGGTIGAPAALATGALIGNFGFVGYNGSGFSTTASAAIKVTAVETFSPTACGAKIDFFVVQPGTTGQIDALTIQSTNVSVNESTASTSPTTGALTVAGGVGVAGALNAGGPVGFGGNLTVSGGDVMIGNNTPTAPLTITTQTATLPAPLSGTQAHFIGTNAANPIIQWNAYSHNGAFAFFRADGSLGTEAALASGEFLGTIDWFGYNGTAYASVPSALIGVQAVGAWTTSNNGTVIQFATTPQSSTTRALALSIYAGVVIGTGTTDPGAGNLSVGGTAQVGSYTVAALPAPGTPGRMAFASNCRMFNGTGTQEGSGAGTGGLVVDNGTAWKIAGTNVTAIA
jgi:Major tropism determinant N-terminal domain